ncbi:MAG TPA: hypothetical protein VGR02_08245 [Thermoanaerobaculia bacterium]|jgi:hypothetical protein|nr:hypothetical protein [Thermoanaerobaculia bacterium]
MSKRIAAATGLLLLSLATAALASSTEPPNVPMVPDDGGEPRVYYAHSYYPGHYDMAGLDDRLSVHVQNFKQLLDKVNGNCSAIVLFIDAMPMKGLKPESCEAGVGHVRYLLQRTPEADETWHELLGSPSGYWRRVNISVGPDTQFALTTTVGDFRLETIPRGMFFLFLVLLLGALIILVYLCRSKGLIRSGDPALPPTKRPYSLALFQMAFWFFLVICAYVFVWMINDELDTITESVLALIGIGAATALGSAVIDGGKDTAGISGPTQGFLTDVLRDNSGSVSLHRFQMFVWTLVLGVIFVASVYHDLAMPQFSATLLGLMGISSGTYLGFKVPEAKATDVAPADATTPGGGAAPPAAP